MFKFDGKLDAFVFFLMVLEVGIVEVERGRRLFCECICRGLGLGNEVMGFVI